MSRAGICLIKHMGKSSPIEAYRADMADDVAERVAGGEEVDAAWLAVIDDKLADLGTEAARIEQVVADAYAARPSKTAEQVDAVRALLGPQDDAAQVDATHKDPGQPAEPVPQEVVAQAISKAAKSEEPTAAPAAEAAAPAVNTEDAGAELTYNRRNRIKSGIRWDDIASKNDALKVKEAVKQNVYPRPDYQALVDGGMQPLVAHLVKQAYDAIAAKPNTRGAPTDADLQTYIAGVNRVMAGVLAWANDPVSLSRWATREARSAGAMLGKSVNLSELAPGGGKSMLESVYPDGWKGNQAEVIVLGGNKLLGALQPSYDEAKRAGKAVDAGWPASQEAWEKRGIKIIHAEKIDVSYYEGKRSRTEQPYVSISYRVGQTRVMDQLIDGAESKDDPKVQAAVAAELDANQGMFIVMDKARRIVGKQETEEAAKDVARELTKRDGKDGGPDDSGIDVAMARREGPPRRLDGENVSSDQLKEAFGFKGVNFGNWMKGDTPALRAERQAHLNHAYDSFADLADLFGVPTKAMSLNGMLGLAIGAQGNGKYAAHFVPGVNEINLTRTSGAGSLAHEWGHALDHYFAEQAGFAKRDEPFLTEHTSSVNRRVVVENGRQRMVEAPEERQIRPEIVERFKAIVQAMNKKPETLEQFKARQERAKETAKSSVNGWLKSIRRDYVKAGVDEAALDAIATRILALNLGDGKIMVSPTLAVHPVVDELRALYRKKAGRVPAIDQIKGLQANLDYYAYAMSEKPGAVDHVPQQVSTDYANAAAGLDKDKGGKRYWSTNLEKFARAFDAYVSDELEVKAAKNTYLSHAGRTGETVPMGEERKTINAAIKALVGEIKTREDDAGNVALFSVFTPTFTVDANPDAAQTPADGQVSPDDRRAVELLQARLNRERPELLLDAVAAGSQPQGSELPGGDDRTFQAAVDIAARLFGKRLTFYKSNIPLAAGVFSHLDPARIFIERSARHPIMAVAGHEMLHAMRYERNDLYEVLRERIRAISEDTDQASLLLRMKRKKLGLKELSQDSLEEEFLADVVGDRWTEPEFWALMSQGQPQGMRRVLAAIVSWLDALVDKIRNTRPFNTAVYLTDIKAARKAVAEAMRNYSAGEVGTVPDDGEVRFSRAAGAGITMNDAEAVAATVRAMFPKAPPIFLHEDLSQVRADVRQMIKDAGAENDAEAMFHRGEIHVFINNLKDVERALFVIGRHEIRHAGMAAMFPTPQQKNQALLGIALKNPDLMAEAKALVASGRQTSRAVAIEEVLADMPVSRLMALDGIDRLIARIRQWLRDAAAALRKKGYASLANAVDPSEWTDNDVAAFVLRAENVSRAGGGMQPASGGTMFSEAPNTTPWYSALARAVKGAAMNAAPASAWKAAIKNWTTTGKAKADEVTWSGLDEWLDLQQGKVTKQAVQQFLDANGVRVQETVLGDIDLTKSEALRTIEAAGYSISEGDMEEPVLMRERRGQMEAVDADDQDVPMGVWRAVDELASEARTGTTKYANYTLPGGTNYREVLLTLPAKTPKVYRVSSAGGAVADLPDVADFDTREEAQAELTSREQNGKRGQFHSMMEFDRLTRDGGPYRSGHWDTPNVLAHIRVNDRTDADGKRVLFVEEIQSDWAQAGAKKVGKNPDGSDRRFGFTDPTKPYEVFNVRTGETVARFAEELDASRDSIERGDGFDYSDKEGKPPLAPFVDKTPAWVSLALKRVIKMAVDGGYDRVAFVTGEQAAERFSLDKQIGSVTYVPGVNGGTLLATDKGDNSYVIKETNVTPEEVADYVGKDVAEKLLAQPADEGSHTLRGSGLVVPQTGMRAFYDKIVLSTARDVVRRLGSGSHSAGSQSVPAQVNRDGGLVDAKAIRNLTLSKAFADQGFKGLAPDVKRLVQSHMLALGKDRQVLKAVVSAVPVDVVNVLRAKQLSPEMFFHDPAMLVDDLAAKLGSDVAARIDVASSLVRAAASVAAESTAVGSVNAGGVSLERGATVGTGFHKDILAQIEIPGVGMQPGFDITEAMKAHAAGGMPMFSRAQQDKQERTAEKATAAEKSALAKALTGLKGIRAVRTPAGYVVNDLVGKSLGTMHWWHTSVGTPYNVALRQPQFKPVFDAIQDFLNDVSHYAAESANKAPTILPKLETLGDVLPEIHVFGKTIGKSAVNPVDAKATAAPVFEGTLDWGRDEDGKPTRIQELEQRAEAMSAEDKAELMLSRRTLDPRVLKMWRGLPLDQFEAVINGRYRNEHLKPGVVWSDAELRSQFNLTPQQIALYREFRAATDQALEDLALSSMLRVAGKEGDDLRAQALSMGMNDAAELLRDRMFDLAEQIPDEADKYNKAGNAIIDIADRVQDLQDRGYAPLSRFGGLTLDVVGPDGERLYFGMFETDRERKRKARELEAQYPEAIQTQGTVSKREWELFAGVTPETLELFADKLGISQDLQKTDLYQNWLRFAKADRSGLKRLIHRKGVPGFSQDIGRVLASFVYSTARQTSMNLHAGTAEDAIEAIDRTQGQLKDYAVALNQYVKNPQEEAQALRGILFAQYLGGSVASAMVNMTQPFMVTFPYLSQFGGAIKAEKQMAKAIKDVGKRVFADDPGLTAALRRAAEGGVVSPQEVFHLQAQASGKGQLGTGDGSALGTIGTKMGNTMSRIELAWGKPFEWAEQFNRRVTFIAAYRTAKEQGMPDPEAFATRAVEETQFVYNKGNRPQRARGTAGALLFTFKTFSISMMEVLTRSLKTPQGRRTALVMLVMIMLVAGVDGLPFMEDMEDVIDGFAQRVLERNWSTKAERNRLIAQALMGAMGDKWGMRAADLVAKGISGLPGAPVDVSGRLGLHNLIPGTGVFLKKDSYSRDVAELAGPAGSMTVRAFEAAGQALGGNIGKAALTISPVAIQNVGKAVEMARTGYYPDTKGNMVVKTGPGDAVSKAIGFQPNVVKRTQDIAYEQQRLVGLAKLTEREIVDAIAQGIVKNDEAAQKAGWARLAQWNLRNPETPIKITPEQVVRRSRNMTTEKTQRILKSTPRELRPGVSEAFNREKALQE